MIQDHGFSRASPSVITNEPRFADTKSLEHFEKKELDRTASQEASLDIFLWFAVNGEGLPLRRSIATIGSAKSGMKMKVAWKLTSLSVHLEN